MMLINGIPTNLPFRSLGFLNKVNSSTDVKIKNAFVDYGVKLIFRHYMGIKSNMVLKDLESFTSNMSVLYIRTKDRIILDFMKQYLMDSVTAANNNEVNKTINNSINKMVDDIAQLLMNSNC